MTDHLERIDQGLREAAELYAQLGSKRAVARALGIHHAAAHRKLKAAARRGYLGEGRGANDPGFHTTKTTVQYDAEGNVIQEWRRAAPTEESLRELAAALSEQVKPARLGKLPALRKSETLGLIGLTDLHVGKYAYAPESGEDYDTNIAVALGLAAVKELTPALRGCGEAVLLINGDHWHADNRSGTTEKSGNILDMDSRYGRNLRAGVSVLTGATDYLLAQGCRVRIVVVPGNHDYHSAICAAMILAAHYRNVQRVHVDTTDASRKAVVWGDCLICASHGHAVKPDKWAQLIPVDPVTGPFWSACPYRYLFLGHIHSRRQFSPIQIQEATGLHVEYLPSLCAPDAWHYEHGYVGAGRQIDALLFHKKYGMQLRATRCLRQIQERVG